MTRTATTDNHRRTLKVGDTTVTVHEHGPVTAVGAYTDRSNATRARRRFEKRAPEGTPFEVSKQRDDADQVDVYVLWEHGPKNAAEVDALIDATSTATVDPEPTPEPVKAPSKGKGKGKGEPTPEPEAAPEPKKARGRRTTAPCGEVFDSAAEARAHEVTCAACVPQKPTRPEVFEDMGGKRVRCGAGTVAYMSRVRRESGRGLTYGAWQDDAGNTVEYDGARYWLNDTALPGVTTLAGAFEQAAG